jgi:hypothetical protein
MSILKLFQGHRSNRPNRKCWVFSGAPELLQRSRKTFHAIRAALEAAGIEFIEQNGGGAGVRLKKT